MLKLSPPPFTCLLSDPTSMSDQIVLVVGGCGCVGYHVVKALVEHQLFSAYHVFSRNPNQNRIDGVQYHAGSITSASDTGSLLSAIQPTAIVHLASPNASVHSEGSNVFYEINVRGTQNLLNEAKKTPSVKIFIYTSSTTVARPPCVFATESASPVSSPRDADHYAFTKAIAESSVLEANNSDGMRTVSLRIGPIYGQRDQQIVPSILKILRGGRQKIQIGSSSSMCDFLSATNAATAHVLAVKALRKAPTGKGRVDGEAFNITDGRPTNFWDFARQVFRIAGDTTTPEAVRIIPAWTVLSIAIFVEWAYFIFTFGRRRPTSLTSFGVRYVSETRTYSITKARERLGYRPADDRDAQIERAVSWYMMEETAEMVGDSSRKTDPLLTC